MKKKTFIVQLLDSKKPSRKSFTQVEDANFYSNDTDASLVFIPHEDTFDFQSAKVVMFNRGDESLVERDMEVTTEDGRKVASYELPDEIISHWGDWIAQPVFISDGEIYSGSIVPFSVIRYLMDNRPPTLRDVIKVDELYSQLVTVMDEISGKDVISAPEIILARGGEDTLGERLDKERNEVTAQLAQKVNKGNISVSDININLGKITPNMVSDELLAQISGTAPVLSVVGDGTVTTPKLASKSVTADKTDFIITSDLNLFNEATSLKGKVLNYQLGVIVDNTGWQVSDYIDVDPNTQYTSNHTFRYVEYDANNTFVTGSADIVSFTTSPQTTKIRLTFPIEITDFIIAKGSDVPVYQDYNKIVGIKGIDISKDVNLENLKGELEYEKSINLYETISPRLNKSMFNSGVIVDSTAYHLLEIPVAGGEEYTVSRPRGEFAIFKNASGEVVSSVSSTTNDVSQSFVVPENATRLFINIYKEYLTDMLIYKGLEYSDGFKLTNLKIDYENVLNSPKFNNQWAGKKGVSFGDSITWYDGNPFISTHTENGIQAVGYQTYLRNDLDVTIDNRGASGNNATQILNIVKSYDFTNTDFATLTSGANDWSQERVIGTIANPKSTFNENTFYGAIQSAVEYMLNQNDSMKIILITPMRGYHPTSTHTGDWVNDTTVDGMLQTPRAYRKAIMDIAELYGLEVIDFYDGLGLNFLNYTEYLGDDPTQTSGKYVHPNNKFYEIVGKYTVNAFRNLTI